MHARKTIPNVRWFTIYSWTFPSRNLLRKLDVLATSTYVLDCSIVMYYILLVMELLWNLILQNYDYAINIFNKVKMKGPEFINKRPPRHW